tara:strand:- start:178 stop:411 length:234 start_codon:yes stop_codon:yes gene_type:complete
MEHIEKGLEIVDSIKQNLTNQQYIELMDIFKNLYKDVHNSKIKIKINSIICPFCDEEIEEEDINGFIDNIIIDAPMS